MSTSMTLRPGTAHAAAVLVASFFCVGLAAHAQPAPSATRDSSAARGEHGIDPAILWTYDTGG